MLVVSLQALGETSGGDLSVDEIIERTRAAATAERPDEVPYQFLREVVIEELRKNGELKKRRTKTYRAYSDGRDQELLLVDGQPPTAEEVESDRKKNRNRQIRFLNREDGDGENKRKERLMERNVDLFHEKFTPELLGQELVGDRPAHIIALIPRPDFRLKSRTMDRVLNAMSLKVWIDTGEYQVAKMEARLDRSVSFLGGLVGGLKDLAISVRQKRVGRNQWVDERVEALFHARFLVKAFHFGMNSRSVDFEPVAGTE